MSDSSILDIVTGTVTAGAVTNVIEEAFEEAIRAAKKTKDEAAAGKLATVEADGTATTTHDTRTSDESVVPQQNIAAETVPVKAEPTKGGTSAETAVSAATATAPPSEMTAAEKKKARRKVLLARSAARRQQLRMRSKMPKHLPPELANMDVEKMMGMVSKGICSQDMTENDRQLSTKLVAKALGQSEGKAEALVNDAMDKFSSIAKAAGSDGDGDDDIVKKMQEEFSTPMTTAEELDNMQEVFQQLLTIPGMRKKMKKLEAGMSDMDDGNAMQEELALLMAQKKTGSAVPPLSTTRSNDGSNVTDANPSEKVVSAEDEAKASAVDDAWDDLMAASLPDHNVPTRAVKKKKKKKKGRFAKYCK